MQAYIYGARAGASNFPIVEDHWLMWLHDKQDMQMKYTTGQGLGIPIRYKDLEVQVKVYGRFSLHFMQHRQEGTNNFEFTSTKDMTKLVHWTLMSQSSKQVTCFELVMKRDHFN